MKNPRKSYYIRIAIKILICIFSISLISPFTVAIAAQPARIVDENTPDLFKSLPIDEAVVLGIAGNVTASTAVKTASKVIPREILKRSTTLAASSAIKIIGYSTPGIGPILGEFAGEMAGQIGESFASNVGKEYKSSKTLDFKKAVANIDWQLCIAKASCGTAGAIAFSIAFPFLGPAAPILGSIVGSTAGGFLFNQIRNIFTNNDKVSYPEPAAPPINTVEDSSFAVPEEHPLAGNTSSGLAENVNGERKKNLSEQEAIQIYNMHKKELLAE